MCHDDVDVNLLLLHSRNGVECGGYVREIPTKGDVLMEPVWRGGMDRYDIVVCVV